MENLSWCDVSGAALQHNARTFKAHLGPGAKLGVVVKSDAYGHGIAIAARALLAGGADWLIVNSVEEAVTLRSAGLVAPIYICGNVPRFQLQHVVATQARVVVYDRDTVDHLNSLGGKTPVHLKLETGTHRQGLTLEDALALGRHIKTLPHVQLEGLTTHFADIEDSTNHSFAESQWRRFEDARQAFAEAGMPIAVAHAANSAATLLFPKIHGDLVRVGLASYGLWPSKETVASLHERHSDVVLKPALSWRAHLVQVKDVPQGGYVGYGRTYRLPAPGRIAVVPIGYYEGYDRRLSNVAHVLVHGQRAPVRGRICMNMFMVDVTHIPQAKAGDVATLLGRDGEEDISAEQLAGWMGTINYEAVSRIHPSIPRVEV